MELQRVFTKVFLWMAIGLAVTFATGYIVSQNPNMFEKVFTSGTMMFLIIAEFGLVIALSAFIRKMSPTVAGICFIVYSFVTGLTFSTIFITYKLDSIMYVFAITAGLFLLFAAIGMFTKMDLTKFGIILLMALIGIIVCSIINIFLKSRGFDLGLCIVGVLVFLAYIAYDIQIIKRNLVAFEYESKLAIYGALQLYLDFINVFIKLLRLFGKSRD